MKLQSLKDKASNLEGQFYLIHLSTEQGVMRAAFRHEIKNSLQASARRIANGIAAMQLLGGHRAGRSHFIAEKKG